MFKLINNVVNMIINKSTIDGRLALLRWFLIDVFQSQFIVTYLTIISI